MLFYNLALFLPGLAFFRHVLDLFSKGVWQPWANLGVILVFTVLCCGVIYVRPSRVSLTDAVMCMNLRNEPLFNIVISYVIF